MRKELLFAFTAFFFMSITAITGAYALEKGELEEKVIGEEKIDLTNDSVEEIVLLKGTTLKDGLNIYKELTLEVTDSSGKKDSMKLDGGVEPKLQFVDIDNNKAKDIYLTFSISEKRIEKKFLLYTYQNNKLTEIEIPQLPAISSQFKEDYKAELIIEGVKTYNFDLYSRKKNYDQLGLYYNGRLNEATELIISPFTSLTVSSYQKKTALLGKQKISGIASVDTIAYLETIWTRKDHKWQLEKMKVKEISDKTL